MRRFFWILVSITVITILIAILGQTRIFTICDSDKSDSDKNDSDKNELIIRSRDNGNGIRNTTTEEFKERYFDYSSKYLANLDIGKRIYGSAFNSTKTLFSLDGVSSTHAIEGELPAINIAKVDMFSFDVSVRTHYAKEGINDVWQGSYLSQLPLAMLAYLSKVQHSLGVKTGTIGEIGVHGGLFFIGIINIYLFFNHYNYTFRTSPFVISK